MVRAGLSGMALAVLVATAGGAHAQGTAPLPSMPRPPSFDDPKPAAGKAGKATRKRTKAASGATSGQGGAQSFERPNKFVPAEFDTDRRGGSGGGASPMLSGSGRPGMGMKF